MAVADLRRWTAHTKSGAESPVPRANAHRLKIQCNEKPLQSPHGTIISGNRGHRQKLFPEHQDSRALTYMNANSIPDLHEVVISALNLHASYAIPAIRLEPSHRRLVIASGNALPTGRILFAQEDALFCDEGQYGAAIRRHPELDSVVVISASGTKHAPIIIGDLLTRGLPVHLITCDATSPAAALLPPERILATRSNPEPITYNTSTYLGMILARTREDPSAIKDHLLRNVGPLMGALAPYEAYYLMTQPRFEVELPMLITKFDELFGARVNGRCYTTEQTLHAKTVVPWDKELFLAFGCSNEDFGTKRLYIPLQANCGYAAMMATAYYVIGHIQAQKTPWFKQHAAEYAGVQRHLFEKVERERKTLSSSE